MKCNIESSDGKLVAASYSNVSQNHTLLSKIDQFEHDHPEILTSNVTTANRILEEVYPHAPFKIAAIKGDDGVARGADGRPVHLSLQGVGARFNEQEEAVHRDYEKAHLAFDQFYTGHEGSLNPLAFFDPAQIGQDDIAKARKNINLSPETLEGLRVVEKKLSDDWYAHDRPGVTRDDLKEFENQDVRSISYSFENLYRLHIPTPKNEWRYTFVDGEDLPPCTQTKAWLLNRERDSFMPPDKESNDPTITESFNRYRPIDDKRPKEKLPHTELEGE